MSERGTFSLDRGWFEHPVFADEPFTEREAWAWLISEAAFKSRRRRVGNTVFDLKRGQLAASVRFMASAWGWHRAKTERFLNKLKIETMIETQSGHDATVITICNYNKYQFSMNYTETQNETPIETSARQARDKLEELEELNNDRKREIDKAGPSKQYPRKASTKTSLILENPDFERFWEQYPKKTDIGAARKLYDRIVVEGIATPDEILAGAMRYGASRSGEDERYTKSAVNWLNGECWMDATSVPKQRKRDQEPTNAKTDWAMEGIMSYFREKDGR